jgi:hypothetical protein
VLTSPLRAVMKCTLLKQSETWVPARWAVQRLCWACSMDAWHAVGGGLHGFVRGFLTSRVDFSLACSHPPHVDTGCDAISGTLPPDHSRHLYLVRSSRSVVTAQHSVVSHRQGQVSSAPIHNGACLVPGCSFFGAAALCSFVRVAECMALKLVQGANE